MNNSKPPAIEVGSIVSTNYDTGPYVITRITGPYSNPSPLDATNAPSEPHYFMTCELAGKPSRGEYYLNGYQLDGTNVWRDDYLFLHGCAEGQMELFI